MSRRDITEMHMVQVNDNEVTFPIPHGMESQMVAEALSAYLLGSQAFHNTRNRDGSHVLGPHFDRDKWILDHTNDFWLSIAGSDASFRCRYPNQQSVLKAVAELFELRYHR